MILNIFSDCDYYFLFTLNFVLNMV